nr:MAG TPA: hypothetical protein [Caudoviricetes sp.]
MPLFLCTKKTTSSIGCLLIRTCHKQTLDAH